MSNLWTELRSGFRQLFATPTVAWPAVACLALGIGANTVIFSLVDGLLLKPPAGVEQPEELISAAPRKVAIPGIPGEGFLRPISYSSYRDYAEGGSLLEGLAAVESTPLDLRVRERVHRIEGQLVSRNFFSILRVALQGRSFSLEEEEDFRPVAVVSPRLLERLGIFAEIDRDLRITLNGLDFTVVGTAVSGFQGSFFEDRAEVWLPLSAAPVVNPDLSKDLLADPEKRWLFWFVGRLQKGVALEAARGQLNTLPERLAQIQGTRELPALDVRPGVGFRPGQRDRTGSPLLILMVLVAVVLLVACANVANLMLARVAAREPEIGVSLALGANRFQMIRKVLVESGVLAATGAVLGVWMATGVAALLEGARLGQHLPPLPPLQLNASLLVFALITTLATTLIFGLAPAMRTARCEPGQLLQGRQRGASAFQTRIASGVVVAQIAASVVLIICAALLVRSLWSMQRIDPGFDSEGIADLRLDFRLLQYEESRGRALYDDILEQSRGLPGVTLSTLAASVPLGSGGAAGKIAPVTDPRPEQQGESTWLPFNSVGPGYFTTLKIPMLSGRDFDAGDAAGAPPVVVINEALAQEYFTEAPLGRRITIGGVEHEVVGVAGNVRQRRLHDDAEPYFFVPLAQNYQPQVTLHMRGEIPARQLLAPARELVASLDPNLPVVESGLLGDRLDQALAQPRLVALLMALLGALALILTLLGLYGVLAYSVALQRTEIGIRMALGAARSEIIRMVVARGLLLVVIGSGLGMVAAAAATGWLESVLHGVSALDTTSFLLPPFLFFVLTLLATGLPAYRATRIDPWGAIGGGS